MRQGANVLVRNIVLHGVNALVYKTWDKEIGRGTGVPQRFNNVVLTVKSGVTPPGTQCVLREGCDPTEVGGTFTLIDADIKIDKVG